MARSEDSIVEKVRNRFGSLCAEARWGLQMLRERIAPQSEEALERCLRELLRDVPYWIRGHILLGRCLIRQMAGAKPEPRSVAALRVTGEAVSRLARSCGLGKARPGVEGKYLLAMAHFLSKDYQTAVTVFQQILALNNAVHFDRPTYMEALENGGAAALAVGDNHLANELFTRIPAELRSRESASALEFLKTQGF